jgi:hypothetical protein
MSKNKFLDYTYNNKHINETDKTEILSLFANLQTYNYEDVFSPDLICKFKRTMMCSEVWMHHNIDKYSGHYLKRGTAVCKNKNRICKLWTTNKDNPFTNDVCYQMIIEYYFHNIFFNSITDNILIVPETYKYGKVILNTNDEILYFYEMEYYDTEKYVLDSINNLDHESKLRKINYFVDILKNGLNALSNMESRILLFHRDHPAYPRMTCIYEYIKCPRNMLIYDDKIVLIDFGEVSRISKTINISSYKTWRDNTSAVYPWIYSYIEYTLRIFDNFFDDALYNECYEYSIRKIGSTEISFRTNHYWEPSTVKDSNLILINDLSPVNKLHQKISDTIKQKCQIDTLKDIQFYYWTPGSHIPWRNVCVEKYGTTPDRTYLTMLDWIQHAQEELMNGYNGCITIYLNKSWNEDWGGTFLYKDGESINGFYPKPNRSIMQCGGIPHSVAPTSKNSDVRLTIQVFF